MQGELRVTVIATGFARKAATGAVGGATTQRVGTPVIPIDPAARAPRPAVGVPAAINGGAMPAPRPRPSPARSVEELSDLEIPTFIRRQMD
jgi:hypothetical protein